MNGLFLSTETLNALPVGVKDLLIKAALMRPLMSVSSTPTSTAQSGDDGMEDPHFAELSPGQARDFLHNVSPKTRAAIVALVQGKSPQVQVKTVARALNVGDAIDLKGVWAGITRRTRTITGDPAAYLIYWSGDQKFNGNGVFTDESGRLREMTYHSFRKALNLD